MRVIKCDRCKKEIPMEKYESNKIVKGFPYSIKKYNDDCTTEEIDLCENCKKSFKGWLQQK